MKENNYKTGEQNPSFQLFPISSPILQGVTPVYAGLQIDWGSFENQDRNGHASGASCTIR